MCQRSGSTTGYPVRNFQIQNRAKKKVAILITFRNSCNEVAIDEDTTSYKAKKRWQMRKKRILDPLKGVPRRDPVRKVAYLAQICLPKSRHIRRARDLIPPEIFFFRTCPGLPRAILRDFSRLTYTTMGTDRYGAKKRRSTGHKLQMETAPAAPPPPPPPPARPGEHRSRTHVQENKALGGTGIDYGGCTGRAEGEDVRSKDEVSEYTPTRGSSTGHKGRTLGDSALFDGLQQPDRRPQCSEFHFFQKKRRLLLCEPVERQQRANAVAKIKKASTVFHLQENGIISEKSRELVTDLVALHNVPVSKVLGVINGDDAPGDHVNRFLGINTTVNHTAETQLQGWKDVDEEMHEVYNTTIGLDNPVDPDTLPPKFTGMNSDHAADQQKLGRGVGGPGRWKEQFDRKIRGEKELRSWDPQVLLPFILAAASKKIEDAGGIDVFTDLPLAVQDTLNQLIFIDVCVQVGNETFDAMSPEEQRAADLFIWAGCCMHKELNAVKGGNAAGMLFHHKDKKKGEGALFQIWFQDALGYNISYPDTSNTRYQSHCETAGMLLLHCTLFLRYLEHMRDRKGNRRFTNSRRKSISASRILQQRRNFLYWPIAVRGPAHSEINLLNLGPLHARVKGFCRDVVANPDLILSPDASWKTASMDGKPWDNPESFYKISSRQSDLPRVREYSGAIR
ncbi:hypothetical protein B0H11DRAFT_1918346 [Mycena galericulata]|nr:hypothetical protein B0H11DRAFT_1918346 [Mycena galericulata]